MKDNVKIIICIVDPNKVHGYDMVYISMLKMSGNTIIELLFTIFKNCLNYFWMIGKKENIVYMFKKATNKT